MLKEMSSNIGSNRKKNNLSLRSCDSSMKQKEFSKKLRGEQLPKKEV
jgi:hypothetical protein